MDYLLVLTVGLLAGVLSGVVGTGSSMMLMPVLVILYGPQQAVPIMATTTNSVGVSIHETKRARGARGLRTLKLMLRDQSSKTTMSNRFCWRASASVFLAWDWVGVGMLL